MSGYVRGACAGLVHIIRARRDRIISRRLVERTPQGCSYER